MREPIEWYVMSLSHRVNGLSCMKALLSVKVAKNSFGTPFEKV